MISPRSPVNTLPITGRLSDGTAGSLVAAHPAPCHSRNAGSYTTLNTSSTAWVLGRPPVQFSPPLPYSRPRLIQLRPRRADIHWRLPATPRSLRIRGAPLPSDRLPGLRLLRVLRRHTAVSAETFEAPSGLREAPRAGAAGSPACPRCRLTRAHRGLRGQGGRRPSRDQCHRLNGSG